MNRINLLRNQLTNGRDENVIIVEKGNTSGTVKIIRMNAPKQLNALASNLLPKLYKTIVDLDVDEETKVIIITGTDKAFAAGADVKKFATSSYSQMAKTDDLLLVENIYYHVNKPLIAAVNGFAFGGGFELALSCDMIIASDKSTFGFPELKLGLFPAAGGSQRLPKLVGYYKAMEYILTTNNISHEDLKKYGIVNNIVPHDELISTCVDLAEKICKFSIMAIIAAKKSMKLSMETNLFGGLKGEKYIFQGLFGSEDTKIGTEAFVSKKAPNFKDK
jgi:enoyl-CoA hydratase/carnithine racemase